MKLFRRPAAPAPLGYIDSRSDGFVCGWACDRSRPNDRLEIELFAAGAMFGRVRANLPRPDLAAAGFGDGCCGFSFALPEGFENDVVAARVAGGDYWLIDNAGQQGALLNSPRHGLPKLSPALSLKAVDETDIVIAGELQSAWRAHCLADRASGGQSTMWGRIVETFHARLLSLLAGDDARALAAYLVDLQKSPESWGLAQGDQAWRDFLAAAPSGRRAAVAPFHDMLVSLAQYLGLARGECAEQNYAGELLAIATDEIVARLETHLRWPIAPPTVFDGLYGLSIGDRVLHGRDIQALYAALRSFEASDRPAPAICEIGGGFGKAAHYAMLLGAARYVIVDLPSVAAMQYFYLRRVLPDTPVRFAKPDEIGDGVSLVFAQTIDDSTRIDADIVVNCDSFPEMGDTICNSYFSRIGKWAPLLLSINQEGARPGVRDEKQSVVGSLLPQHGFRRLYRFRSWVRRGFIEEVWRAPDAAQ